LISKDKTNPTVYYFVDDKVRENYRH